MRGSDEVLGSVVPASGLVTSRGLEAGGEVGKLLARAKAAEDALLNLTCSGSEFFIRDGDGFRVDVPACVAYIRRSRDSQHEAIKRALFRAKDAERALSIARPALEAIAHPSYGLGFNKLRGLARAALAKLEREGGSSTAEPPQNPNDSNPSKGVKP